jgi:hypothetical protein
MRRFWLFRSNLRGLEYYHKYKTLKAFKNNCHDYYLLFPLWLLENDYFDEITIWRLTNTPRKPIIFKLKNGKSFNQKWCPNFKETLKYHKPQMTFWRGGFAEYDAMTRLKPAFFGKKLYLGAGRRIFSQWNGKYDAYLIEDERDFVKGKNCIPFYKTASPQIFKPLDLKQQWDICWPCNFTQLRYKGQKYFIKLISKNPELQKLKIVHCGNKPEVGQQLCTQMGVKNIKFLGPQSRPQLNKILNKSKLGLNLSNLHDGCPRMSTEILMSGTPLILRDTVRLLKDFRKKGVVNVDDKTIVPQILTAVSIYKTLKGEVLETINNELSFDNINKKNIDIWQKI